MMEENFNQMDEREIELPNTIFARDVESRVFQAIVLKCLAKIEGISLLGGTLIDSLLGREIERIKGIYVEQDQKKHSVHIRVEINVAYGISIPEKAEEVQSKIVEEISSLTGLHVSCVHVVFKNLIHTEIDPLIPEKEADPALVLSENTDPEEIEQRF